MNDHTLGPGTEPTRGSLTGRWVRLRPPGHHDYELLRAAELSDALGPRWRHRGATPSPESFAQSLWAGVLAQHLVVDRRDGRPLGLVCAYGADLQSGTALVAFTRLDPADPGPRFGEGVFLFVDHLFTTWPFRKLCGESLAGNLDPFGSAVGSLLVEEGRWRSHVLVAGQHVDVVLLALWRDTWEHERQRLLPRGGGEADDHRVLVTTAAGGAR